MGELAGESTLLLPGMLCTQVLMAEGRDSKATNTFSRCTDNWALLRWKTRLQLQGNWWRRPPTWTQTGWPSGVGLIEGLRNKTWMLNHGVADDNVHYQHTMLLTKALERADIQFVQHSYPDENHSLGGVSRFLYHAMDSFWADCFKEPTV